MDGKYLVLTVEEEFFKLLWVVFDFFSEHFVLLAAGVGHNGVSQFSSKLHINLSSLILDLSFHHIGRMAFIKSLVAILASKGASSNVFDDLLSALGTGKVEMFAFSTDIGNEATDFVELRFLLVVSSPLRGNINLAVYLSL